MFYIKTELTEGVTLKTEITSENVATICPECGEEHHVDLVDILGDGGGDLYSTQVYCPQCSEQRTKDIKPTVPIKPNLIAIENSTGIAVDLAHSTFLTYCPDCGKEHEIDLADIILTMGDNFTGFEDVRVRCAECSKH